MSSKMSSETESSDYDTVGSLEKEMDESMEKMKAKFEALETGATAQAPPGACKPPVKKPVEMFEEEPYDHTTLTNYFKVEIEESWHLNQYHLIFDPEVLDMRKRSAIVRQLKKLLCSSAIIFDGTSLFTPLLLERSNPVAKDYFAIQDKDTKVTIEVTMKLVRRIDREDDTYNQAYNLMVRSSMFAMGLEEIGRNFYDRNNSVDVQSHRIQLWPGYVTSIRQYDQDILICVDIIHRVLRMDNILCILNNLKKSKTYEPSAINELKHTIVMTQYNKKTYRVDDIDWSSNPTSTFVKNGQNISFVEYYKQHHNLEISDLTQPLLLCRPTKKEARQGIKNDFLLIPELCQVTGLSDSMRTDNGLMKAVGTYLHMSPEKRVQAIEAFVRRLLTNENVIKILQDWKISIVPKLVSCPFRILKRESIVFASNTVRTNDQADWTTSFRNSKLLKVNKELKTWVIITPKKDFAAVNELIRTIHKVAGPLNFKIHPPQKIIQIEDLRVPSYLKAVNSIEMPVDLVFFILPYKALEPYTSLKRCLSVDLGIPSQGFVSRNLYSKGLMSIVTKVVIQINAKLGGEPWGVRMPVKDSMIVGYDIQKCSGGYVGALVSTNSLSMGQYFSNTALYSDVLELSALVVMQTKKAVESFFKHNNEYPKRIVLLRDSISQGQEDVMLAAEAKVLVDAFGEYFATKGLSAPKFAFIVVNKQCGTRLFSLGIKDKKMSNPTPGTVVHQAITVRDVPNFFMAAQYARQGCISPSSFKIVHNETQLDMDKLQLVCFKLCHMYYNWSGTVAVPSPCQYASKLAYVVANYFNGDIANPNLDNSLHFL